MCIRDQYYMRGSTKWRSLKDWHHQAKKKFTKDWRRWKEKFSFNVSLVVKENELSKLQLFKYLIGNDGRESYNTLRFEKEEKDRTLKLAIIVVLKKMKLCSYLDSTLGNMRQMRQLKHILPNCKHMLNKINKRSRKPMEFKQKNKQCKYCGKHHEMKQGKYPPYDKRAVSDINSTISKIRTLHLPNMAPPSRRKLT